MPSAGRQFYDIIDSIMSTDLIQQITQFQTRYPFGSLTSELLMVHGDTYVIRAIAQVGSVVVATAMATHTELEQAEDRAKMRVLATLNLSPKTELAQEPAPSTTHKESSNPTPNADSSEPLRQSAPLPASFVSSGRPSTDPLPPIDETIPGLDLLSPTDHPPAAWSEPEQTLAKPRLALAQPSELQPQSSAEETLTPQDLSDIIAKTSVELRRLGWTDKQGREHLQNTYGKRSRQQLTDPELVDFLRYLEQQSAPPQT